MRRLQHSLLADASARRELSEREWLRAAKQLWEHVKRSSQIADYQRTMQQMKLY